MDKVLKADLGDSGSQNYKINDGSKSYFVKTIPSDLEMLTENEKKAIAIVGPDMLISKYRTPIDERTPEKLHELETSVLSEWNKSGVPSPTIYSSSNPLEIKIDWIDGVSYANLISSKSYSPKHHTSLIDSLKSLRDAKHKNPENAYVLHNDLQLNNVMFVENSSLFVDPGCLFDQSLSSENLDAYFNLFFLYSLNSANLVGDSKGQKIISEGIKDDFVSLLSYEEKNLMLELNDSFVPDFSLRKVKSFSSPGNYAWWTTFGQKNYKSVNESLSK